MKASRKITAQLTAEVIEDITARKQTEETWQQAHAQLTRRARAQTTELQQTEEARQVATEELASAYAQLQLCGEEVAAAHEEVAAAHQKAQDYLRAVRSLQAELCWRTEELERTQTFLDSILSNLRAGIVIVDQHLNILTWSRGAERLWGLFAEEVQGQPFLELAIGLPVEQLRAPLGACVAGESTRHEVVLEATNSRQQAVTCRVTCTPLYSVRRERQGVVLVMEPREK